MERTRHRVLDPLRQPDVEIWSKYASLDEGGGPYRGHAGMRESRAEIDRNFELHEVFTDDVRDLGGKVLVLGGVHFRGEASGLDMRHPFAWVCEMRDGALARMFFYSSHAEVLEAAGVRGRASSDHPTGMGPNK